MEATENIFYASPFNDAMEFAMEKARLTLAYFVKSLSAPQAGQTGFSLKVRLEEEGSTEHIWTTQLRLEGEGQFSGELNNPPANLSGYTLGQRIAFGKESVSDWMILESGELIGGYTLRAYREGLDEAGQAGLDNSLGFVIGEGVDHFPLDHSTPEGAILCLEDAYTRKDLEAAVACKNFVREAGHMLARIPNFPLEEKLVHSAAETLELSFRAHFAEHGMPDYTGVKRAFPVREYESEDAVMVTEICTHPDGSRTLDKLWVYQIDGAWKVGAPANEDP